MKQHLPPETIAWAKAKCEEVIRTCQVSAIDGTILFTPDGVGAYGALWTRDFAYLVEHGAEFLKCADVRAAIDVLVVGQRADGAVPDRVNKFLVPLYQPGETAKPIGAGPALDNGMFLVSLVFHYHRHFGDDDYVAGLVPALRRGLAFVPRNRGLVFNDAQKPSSTYGFQDTIGKGGHDLFCSLLWVVACRQMSVLDREASPEWTRAGAETEQALALLWDEDAGAYLAANERCRQIDIWGNAFLVAHEIGDETRREGAALHLQTHYDRFMYRGQVRHLSAPQHWEHLLADTAPGTYQNGGYWGTPSGWLIEALTPRAPELAEKTFSELLAFYREQGVLEWSTPDGKKGPDLYVATIVNVWSLVKRRAG